ncbi:unnamed protein product [Mytilus edulis]|uniref:Novel STAND NTPase 3 domain-containing protein n=1 Tax=Mytilus edulis TaxID=6550 RepID=A0A8S3SYF3_MYTED|nr:unnamed protein product [Mytilus edulis]
MYPEYDVVKVSDLHLVEQLLNKDSKMILLLEDVFGKTNCKFSKDSDKSVLDFLQSYIDDGTVKIIFTIRSEVKKSLQYQDLFSSHRIFKGFEEIDLDSSKFKMTVDEKKKLLTNYCLTNNIKIVNAWENENYDDESILDKKNPVKINEATLISIVNIETYLGFPESCYMFTTNRALTRLGIRFFKHPSRSLNHEIDCLRRNGEYNSKERISYITLVYTLLSSNTLKINDFDESLVASILKSCYNRDKFIKKGQIVDAAGEMTGGYLTCNAEMSVFQFQHQTIFESILLSYYKVDPKLVLTTIDFEMIREIVKLCNFHAAKEEIRMIVPKELYGDLARRLFIIFRDQFSHMPSIFIKVLCDSDLMTYIDGDFVQQLCENFTEASNLDITTLITYEGKSEEVAFCLTAAILWYTTLKGWTWENVKIIMDSLKCSLRSETRSNVGDACKRTIIAAFLYSCDKKKTDTIEPFLKTIDELEIRFDINRYFQDLVYNQNQSVASCVLQHFSQKINIVEAILETDREKLHFLLNILSGTFFCSNIQYSVLINDRTKMIKWFFSSVDPMHFNMTEAVQTSGNKGLLEVVDWFIKTFQYKLFNCQVLMKEACRKGWETVVSSFLKEEAYQAYDFKSILIAAYQYSWHTIAKELLEKSTMETFEVTDLMTEACRKSDFENVTSLIIYIAEKDISLNNTIKNVFEALKNNASWCLSDFCTNFVKVLLTHIDSNKTLTRHEDLKSLRTINLFLDCVSETTFNFRVAVAESISDDIVHKQNWMILNVDPELLDIQEVILFTFTNTNSYSIAKSLLETVNHNLFDMKTVTNRVCWLGKHEMLKSILELVDPILVDMKTNTIEASRIGHLGVVKCV